MNKIVDRKVQVITSKYGLRKRWNKIFKKFITEFHKGIDLRTWNLHFYTPQNILAPEKIEIIDIWNNEKWGQGVSFKFLDNAKFGVGVYRHTKVIHGLEVGQVIEKDMVIGKSMVTKYMKLIKASHHLHFEIWTGGRTTNPVLYMDHMKIIKKIKGKK